MIDYNNATIGISGSVLDGTASMILAGHLAAPVLDPDMLDILRPRSFSPNAAHPEWQVDFDIARGTTIGVADTGTTYRWNGDVWFELPGGAGAPAPSAEIPTPLLVGGALLLSWVFLVPALFSH